MELVAPQVLHYRAHPLPPMPVRGMFPHGPGQEGEGGEMEGEEAQEGGDGEEEGGIREAVVGS